MLAALGGTKASAGQAWKRLMGMHGAAMLLSLVGGMGAAATSGFLSGDEGVAPWIWLKLVIWLVLGAAAALPGRVPSRAGLMFVAIPLLVALAAWTAGGFLPLTRP